MRVAMSFGGGVQSTSLAVLLITEKIKRPDDLKLFFADTGDEPDDVYRHIDVMIRLFEKHGIDFEIVKRKGPKLSEHVLNGIEAGKGNVSYPPLYVKREQSVGYMPLFRGCTQSFKTSILDKHSKAWAKVPRGYKGSPLVSKWLGISFDEQQRARISDKPWYVFEYPLIDLGLRRTDCLKINSDFGLNAPRSACVYCPFHSNAEWRRIKKHPKEWKKAVDFERKLHDLWKKGGGFGGLRSMPHLHKSGVPLERANLNEAQQQLWDDWDQECAGVCGV